jgi:hypothetical protein
MYNKEKFIKIEYHEDILINKKNILDEIINNILGENNENLSEKINTMFLNFPP